MEVAAGAIDPAAFANFIETDPDQAEVLVVLGKLTDLLGAAQRLAMTPDEYAALRAGLLAPVAPGGMPLATFESVVDRRPRA